MLLKKAAVSKQNDDVILDIGGNDGTMLSYIDQEVGHKVNIDAAHGIGSVNVWEVHKDRGPI